MISFPNFTVEGLGNQLFQYAFLRTTAQRLGVRFWCPEWIGDHVLCLDDADERTFDQPDTHRVWRESRFRGMVPDALCIEDGTAIHGYFQTERYYDREKVLHWYRFREDAVRQVKEKYAHVDLSQSVALSVRLTDMLYLPVFYSPEPGYFARALERCGPHESLLLFSDDPVHAQSRLAGLIPDPIVVDGNEPYEALYLLSQCRDVIGSASTFSWWGAWLNTSSPRTVVFPAEGPYRPGAPVSNPDFLCPEWLTEPALSGLSAHYYVAFIRWWSWRGATRCRNLFR